MQIKKRTVFIWIKIVIILYCGAGIALFYLQDRFVFQSTALPANHKFEFNVPFEEVNIPFNSTDTVNMVRFLRTDPVKRGVVLYFHGNKDNIEHYAQNAANFTSKGYEVWMEDYPGFGKTTGTRTEKKMYQQAMQIYTLAQSKFNQDSIIIYGRSLGSGVAAYVAASSAIRFLILETPYNSIPGLFSSYAPIYPTSLMSNYKFPVDEYLPGVKFPIVIFHGDNDNVIPYRCAAKLKKVLKATDEFVTIKNGGHNNLNDFPMFHQKLDSMLLLP